MPLPEVSLRPDPGPHSGRGLVRSGVSPPCAMLWGQRPPSTARAGRVAGVLRAPGDGRAVRPATRHRSPAVRTSPVIDVWSAMPCIACGCPGTQRCTTGPCKRPTRQSRGYTAEHDRLRAAWVELVEDGQVECERCGLPIQPGTPWDLGHDDIDRSKWSGPEHRGCNRSAGGRAAHGLPPRPRRSTEDDDL